jgi:hypothetical protein
MKLSSARRRPPTRRAIPTAEIVGRVKDFGGWYQIASEKFYAAAIRLRMTRVAAMSIIASDV